MAKPNPRECPLCEYDRRFPGFEAGGWIQQDNNGSIVSCPMCNHDGSHPRDADGMPPTRPFRVTRMVEIINSPHFGFDLYSDPTCIAECEI